MLIIYLPLVNAVSLSLLKKTVNKEHSTKEWNVEDGDELPHGERTHRKEKYILNIFY